MTKRAALYLRQSKTDDEGIDRQTERTTALATARGWRVVATYVDNDVSASKPRGPRTAWGQMLAHSAEIDVVIGVDLDRVVRSTRDINVLIDHGMMLVTIDGEIDLTTADGEFRATMLASIARFEVRRKGERQTRANVQRASRGGVPKGTRLTGYNADGTVLEHEAEIVRRIFDEFTRNKALTRIAQGLNADAVDTRSGRPWHPSSVRTILLNARYAGRRVYKGAVVAGPSEVSWTPIVTEPIFDKAQGILSDEERKTNRQGTARKYIGSGLYLCGPCRVRVTSNGKRYACPKCGRIRTMAPIDKRVFDAITERFAKPDLAAALAQPKDEAEDRRLQGVVKDARAQLTNIERDYDDGLIDGRRYQASHEKAMTRLRGALEARVALAGNDELASIASAPNPAQAFLDADFDTQRSVINACMFVVIQPVAQGTRGFDPATVVPAWRHTFIGDEITPTVPQVALDALR